MNLGSVHERHVSHPVNTSVSCAISMGTIPRYSHIPFRPLLRSNTAYSLGFNSTVWRLDSSLPVAGENKLYLRLQFHNNSTTASYHSTLQFFIFPGEWEGVCQIRCHNCHCRKFQSYMSSLTQLTINQEFGTDVVGEGNKTIIDIDCSISKKSQT